MLDMRDKTSMIIASIGAIFGTAYLQAYNYIPDGYFVSAISIIILYFVIGTIVTIIDMNMLTNIFYTIAILIAGYSGYNNLEWYFIIISAITFLIGYGFARLHAFQNILNDDGIGGILKLISIQIIIYSILSGIIYFIALSIGN